MRIIDKNTDFYDIYQNVYHDDSLIFDRTDSFLLLKEDLCGYLPVDKYTLEGDFRFLLLQVCTTFRLFLVTIVKLGEDRRVRECTIELLDSWKNYNKPRRLIQLEVISFGWNIRYQLLPNFIPCRRRSGDIDKKNVIEKKFILTDAINTSNYRVDRRIDRQQVSVGGGKLVEKHIPLLKSSGLASWIDPLDIYLAIEEYFSQEKTATERSESIGLTDEERIVNHGFDLKESFRGKIVCNKQKT